MMRKIPLQQLLIHPPGLLGSLSGSRDGNGHEKSAYPRIPNPRIADMGGNLCPQAQVRVQL
jgi:hypothetical protein